MGLIASNLENTILEKEDHRNTASDIALCVAAKAKLNKAYPGHMWQVELDEDVQGMCKIINLDICAVLNSNLRYGYWLYLGRLYADPSLKCVMRAGGEILERANLRRGWATGEDPKYVEGVLPKHQPGAGRLNMKLRLA